MNLAFLCISMTLKKNKNRNLVGGGEGGRLLPYEWFRNLTFTVVIALLITASSFFGHLHSHTSSLRSLLHRDCPAQA